MYNKSSAIGFKKDIRALTYVAPAVPTKITSHHPLIKAFLRRYLTAISSLGSFKTLIEQL